jgi:hypothetical protein
MRRSSIKESPCFSCGEEVNWLQENGNEPEPAAYAGTFDVCTWLTWETALVQPAAPWNDGEPPVP